MNIIDIIKGKDKRPNPEYNPKTKKGALEPPSIVNTDYNKRDDFASNILENVIPNQYGLSYLGDPTKYTEYDVTVNPVNTVEELNKERANNQSVFEQGAYAIGQTLNEITTGTVLGAADLASILIDAMDGDLSYERPDIIESLAQFKESIDEQMPIYRKDPTKAFDVTDFAWWASNAPSIASSLTLMVPGVGVSKGLSKIGSLLSINKAGNKLANVLKLSEKTRELAAKGIDATKTGITMRMLENYQESNQTSKNAYDYAIKELNSMDAKQRAEFDKNNPEYANKTNEEIAKDIANNAGDETFDVNLWNTMFDIAQVYGLKNMWSKALQGSNTRKLQKLNKAAAAKFGDEAAVIQEAIAKTTFKDKAIDKIKDIGYGIATGTRNEWTEGIEEAINYIGSEKGMELAKLAFDKDTDIKTVKDYLKDPMMWESAFWGVIGGVVFSGAADAAGGFIQRKLNKEWTNAEDKKKQEILNRQLHFQRYNEAINSINQNKNPYITIRDAEGNQVAADIINDTERQELEKLARNSYFDGMIIDAIDNGNLELLEEFARDTNIAKGFKEKLNLKDNEALELQKQFIERIDNTKELYLNVFDKVNKVGGNFDIGRIIARQLVEENNKKQLYDTLKLYNDNLYNKVMADDNINISLEDVSAIEKLVYRNRIRAIENQIFNTKTDANLSKREKKQLLDELENQKKQLEEIQPADLYDENGVVNDKQIIDTAKKVRDNYSDEFNTIYGKFNNDLNYRLNEKSVDLTEPALKKRVTELRNVLDESRRKIINNAIKTQNDLYRKYRDNFDVANMEEKDADAYNTSLKVLQEAEYDLNNLELQKEFIDEELNRQVAYDETVNKDDDVPELDGKPVDDDITSSTGKLEEDITTDTSKTPETTITPEAAPVATDTKDDKASSRLPVEDNATTATAEPTLNLAELSENELYDAASEELYNQLDSIAVASNINIDELNDNEFAQFANNNKEAILNKLLELGFSKEIVDNTWMNTISAFTDDLAVFGDNNQLQSAISESDRVLLKNATLSIIKKKPNKKQRHIIAILEEFAKKQADNGKTYGRTIKGKTYINADTLTQYIYNLSNNRLVAEFLYDEIKSFIYSKNNTEYVLTDNDTILNLSKEQYKNRLLTLTSREKAKLEEYIPNNANIDDTDFETITKLNPGDELEYEYDTYLGRIILRKDGNFVGYLGVPQIDNEGVYRTTNEGWLYDIALNESFAKSKLKDFILKVFTEPTEDLESALRAFAFSRNKKDDVKIYRDQIFTELSSYPEFINFRQTLSEIQEEAEKQIENIVMHIGKLYARVAADNFNIEESVNNWFNKLANSYAQAHVVATKKAKGKFVIDKLYKGTINLSDPKDKSKLNNITKVIDDYNEDKYPLVTITKPNNLQFANSLVPNIVNGYPIVGMTMIAIPRENGQTSYAYCYQKELSSNDISPFGKQLIDATQEELKNIITRFISDNTYSFKQFSNDVFALTGNSGLININVKPGRRGNSIGFQTKDNKWLFSIYDDASGRKLQINSIEDTKYNITDKARGATIRTINDEYIQNELKKNIDNLFANATIGIPFSFINDKVKIPVATKYYKRENGKTIISVGKVSKEFNSYQDFLVSNNFLSTNLQNLPKNEDNTISGIFHKTNLTTVQVVFKADETSWINTANLLDDKVNAEFVIKQLAINKTNNALREMFRNNNEVLGYIEALERIGILPEVINIDNIVDTEAKPIYALYDINTKEITLNGNRIDNMNYGRLIRTIIHESLHKQLDTVYNKEKALNTIEDIYNRYKQYVEELEKKEPNNEDLLYLKQFIDISQDRDINLEEFLVESLTNRDLMSALNKIPASSRFKDKVKNLFQELLLVIADMLGIEIDRNSLLYREMMLLNKITKGRSKKTQAKKVIQTTLDFKDEQDVNKVEEEKQEIIKTDDVQNDNKDTSNTKKDIKKKGLRFSIINEQSVTNFNSVVNNISPSLQAAARQMLTTGELSMYCM